MIRNYLNIMMRHMNKQKIHTFINICSLAVGFACCLLIFLFVHDEFSFDRFHGLIDRIYEVKGMLYFGDAMAVVDAQTPLGPSMVETFPEVVDACRMTKERLVFKCGDRLHEEVGIAADPSFFSLFTIPMSRGDGIRALEEMNQVILSRNKAEKYFQIDDPMGKTIHIRIEDDLQPFIVAGVADDMPLNSSIQFDFIVPISRIYGPRLLDWNDRNHLPTFIQLADGADPITLASKFPDTIDKAFRRRFEEKSGYRLQPFMDHHLKSEWGSTVLEEESQLLYSHILMGIGGLILLIACFNFVNLSIGNASGRMKEVGMRRVLGAQGIQLRRQFLLESVSLSVVALLFALLFVQAALPLFNHVSQKSLVMGVLIKRWTPVGILAFTIFIGLVAGWAPASVLARIDSLHLFKKKRNSKNVFSRCLLVLQFGMTTVFIIATLFMRHQYRYLLQRELGYNREHIAVIPVGRLLEEADDKRSFFRVFEQEMEQDPGVVAVSGAVYGLSRFWMSKYPELTDGSRILIDGNDVDEDFVRTMGINLMEGRFLSEAYAEDLSESVLVNETLVEKFGLEEPVGTMLSDYFIDTSERMRIVGIVQDFHYSSVKTPIRPAFLKLGAEDAFDFVFVKMAGIQLAEELARIKEVYETLLPNVPFEYYFLGERLAGQYALESRWSRIVGYASVLTIIIACLGVFGLTLITADRRTKEIGIRKVLGASASDVVRLIQGEFLWLVVISNIIAWPAAYFVMREFMKEYPYRVSLNAWVFLTASVVALLIACFTVFTHAARAAGTNPVNTLRYE